MTQATHPRAGITLADVAAVSPALAHITQTAIVGDLWSRPGLAPSEIPELVTHLATRSAA
ncbi:hypothetical protein NX786_01540 [Telluria mixta]|uniref:Uncharacterized protein n=1 Tax=Telluria mixta TaxID=34071 RepID=A0ABT2BSC9_9BURK|nr:hypothetical protein [Telluria mixta]MCS0628027.1 hypothetical protein [Telluria mixta]WEM93856.1 hypothetical protein P0M04_20450 [Telluria mixta]